jgi:tubulin-specific chaperone D
VPEDFANQLLDAILDVYDIFTVEGEDLTPAAEPSWHGATLACAEFARQGLIHASRISNTINRVSKVYSY